MNASHDHSHGHSHDHAHDHGHHGHLHHVGDDQSVRNLTIAFWLNFVFTIAEIIGGIWTNSIAILADALHDLGDSLSLALALVMQRLSRRGRDKTFSYGYRRFSLLAIAGIVFNGAAALRMHGGQTLIEQMVRWPLLEDVMGWVAVLITAIVMLFWDLPVLDPLLSIGINLFILYNVSRVLWETVKVFLQSVPDSVSVEKIESEIRKGQAVASIHDTHLWSLDGQHNILTTHVVVSRATTLDEIHAITGRVRAIAKSGGVSHATIKVEREDDDCGLIGC